MFRDYLKAGFPALYALTHDVYRAEKKIPEELSGWRTLFWDCCHGIYDQNMRQIEELLDPVDAVNYLTNLRDTVIVFHNLNLFISPDNPNPTLIQTIINGLKIWKSIGSSMIILAPEFKLSKELENLFTLIDYPLPDSKELFELQKSLAPNVKPNRRAAYSGALGLSEYAAENAYSISLIKKGFYSTKEVSLQKEQILKKSGLLELHRPEKLSQIGGLNNLKDYILKRSKAITADNTSLPRPKAFLLVGVPGTGKSLACKSVASILNFSLIRLNIGSLKGSLVGESERKIREATNIIDSMQNLVIWIDEIEKQFSGAHSGISDGGSSAGQLAHFLTWMQETTSRILIVATANNISQLPPEFLRSGRFDATFFVDLPSAPEREHIISIMNKKYDSQIPLSYVDKLQNYSGAEIEQLAKDSLFEGLEVAYQNIVPLSKTMREEIDSLRKWARHRARYANTIQESAAVKRKIITN